ncbi:hypothetical protein Riv7116_3062 [Rivularia sp. PCC 7116]|uniref:hypothetical protein n=1 Tax=Rivularia sp. PCC 7116 TaxID=373994 RepID=UPI00029F3490|nr:hypothetical protein [Rivularia sp. PCC 7116]AFY55539.1 hypothetical protein Riv7116_3062 [Rivularia sp. PCC 7116]
MANNAYTISENLEEFGKQINADLSQGLDLIGTAYADGSWVGLYQDTLNSTGYATASSASELRQIVEQQWQVGGYRLTDVEYGDDGVWFGTFEEDDGANNYSIANSFTQLQEDISQLWDKGWELVDVEYGDGIWFGTYRDVPGGNNWASADNYGDFYQATQAMLNDGYDLVDFEYGDGIWFGTFQQDSSITSGFVVGNTFDELVANGQQYGNQGYEFVDFEYIEYSDGGWLGVMEKETPQNTAVGDALLPLKIANERAINEGLADVLYDYGSVDYYGG